MAPQTHRYRFTILAALAIYVAFTCGPASQINISPLAHATSPQARVPPIPTQKILALLKRGKASGLKRVLIKMQDDKDVIVCFRAEGSRFYVTGEKKSHVYGDISADGLWQPTGRATRQVIDKVKKVERDPLAYVSAHGLKSRRCCFCSRKLTVPESVHSGYGPVCAKRYGLPWAE